MKVYLWAISIVTFGGFLTISLPYSVLGAVSVHGCAPPPFPQSSCPAEKGSLSPGSKPNVTFPGLKEIYAYINQSGGKKEFTALSNESQGFSTGVETAMGGNMTWIAWLGKINETNHVFARVSLDDKLVFAPAVELSNGSESGNASDLQLATSEDGRLVYAVWENRDPVTNQTSILVSASMNGGADFKTYSLNKKGDSDAVDPKVKIKGKEVILTWRQLGPNGECSDIPGTACAHGRW